MSGPVTTLPDGRIVPVAYLHEEIADLRGELRTVTADRDYWSNEYAKERVRAHSREHDLESALASESSEVMRLQGELSEVRYQLAAAIEALEEIITDPGATRWRLADKAREALAKLRAAKEGR